MKEYCYGVVEDRADPLKIGRVRVRVRGYHSYDKNEIATPDLPWSHVIMPVTTPGLTPFGSNHALVEGTEVFGFFRDEEMQDYVVLGVQQGITQNGIFETITNELLERDIEKGFSDPRRHKKGDYEGTTDGLNPPAGARPNELAVSLREAPHLPKEISISFEAPTDRIVYKKTEFEDEEKTLPYYPLKTDTSDVNQFSALDKQVPKERKSHNSAPLHRDLSAAFPDIKDKGFGHPASTCANPQYPYNHATYTESGHLFELDDTRSFERVSLQHRTGTYFEWQSNGDAHERIVKDKYEVILGHDEIYVGGNVKVVVKGDAKVRVSGKADITSKKQITLTSPIIKAYGNTIGFNS